MKTLAPIPKEGERYLFYTDDIIKEDHQYIATIKKVYPLELTGAKFIYQYSDYAEDIISVPLLDLWMEALDELFWILDIDTDYILEISVPELCRQPVFVARDLDGGWHSFVVLTEKEFGILDTTKTITNTLEQNSDVDNQNIDDLPIGGEYYW